MEQYNLTYSGEELDRAIGRAAEGFAKADAVTQEMEQLITEVETKLDTGDFVGPRGVSGVYVGGGEMPEGYNVQIDPSGSGSCYMAAESDSRYANAITGETSGAVVTLTDAWAGGVLQKCEISGQEAGIAPTKVTVCGKNLFDISEMTYKTGSGSTYEVLEDSTVRITSSLAGKYRYASFTTHAFDHLKGREVTVSTDIAPSGSNNGQMAVQFLTAGAPTANQYITKSLGYKTFTVPDSFDEVNLVFYANVDSAEALAGDSITYANIQIETGNIRTAFESFISAEYAVSDLAAITIPSPTANIFADAGEVSVTYTKDTNKVIAALTERISALEGGNEA